ncbi:o-succinylbenzoate synthase [Microbacterium paludicola]|uniref:o-succinylbenzoate synthase n=1 Tax=Microbacterium paludicola TaxID=300019 RepID=A0A4Y9FUB4_9MICO|nr:o-succinylbenzoate synthase [Microbacterium paludicola]MBF0817185.1 o-succinylbenzoate synthase [Microbacterium paludicola]TFU32112.1 o-succinylbenzoate synthase [Microbacterium paludicola]
MRVAGVAVHRVALPLKHRFQTSSHSKHFIEHLLVALTDETGAVGWGEIAAPSDPYFGSETTDTAWLVAERYLVPAILGTEFDGPAALEAAWTRIRGHHFAKSGFSVAAWVLEAQRQQRPLAALLGGTRTAVTAGISLGIEPTIDALVLEVATHVESGYPRVKLKVAPGWDVEPVRAVRAAFPGLDLHVDANGGYPAVDESFRVLQELDEHGLTMIEQPFHPRDFHAHAKLQARVQTPICLDESVEDLHDLQTMIDTGAGRVLNIKVSRIGGFGSAIAAHDLAAVHGIPVWCGGMHEFGIGRLANVAISSLPNFSLPSDVSGSDKYYERDVVIPPVVARHGVVDVPTEAGLGGDIDHAWIAANRRDLFTASA